MQTNLLWQEAGKWLSGNEGGGDTGKGREITNRCEETSADDGMFTVLIVMMVSWVYTHGDT